MSAKTQGSNAAAARPLERRRELIRPNTFAFTDLI
jgi:hypothetical protein